MTAAIRAYEPADLPEVRALIEQVLAEFGFHHAIGGIQPDLEQITSRYASSEAGFWVAQTGSSIIGTVAVRPKAARTCELKRLYVRKDHRGTGLGQLLYDHAETFARTAGYDRIWLDSSRRFHKAHRLYERNGFILLEQLDNDWEDNVYEKPLA